LATGVTCYGSQAQAESAAGVPQATTQELAASPDACAANDGSPLALYQNINMGGWSISLYSEHGWYDLDSESGVNEYNDAASSFHMGGHSGHISDGDGGSGAYYPGSTDVCANAYNMGAYAISGYGAGATWNDKASSRYRN
jgi:hypothetical protein